jgi:uncharacterized protein (DUF58 family)
VTDALLGADYLRRLEALRRRLGSRVQSGATGETSGPRRGAGAEFREHRPYAAGDDLRRVDWMAYARSGEPVVKLYRAEEDRVVRLLVDGSASMGFGAPAKLARAQQFAAALGYLSLAASERAEVLVARSAEGGSGIAASHPARRGRRSFPALCRELLAIRAQGKNDLARAIENLILRTRSAGVLAIVSDFFDPGPLATALTRARSAGHELVLIQILDATDINPDFEGDALLEDAETGQHLELTADPGVLAAYARSLSSLIESLRTWSRKHGGVYVRSTAASDLEDCVERIVSRAID